MKRLWLLLLALVPGVCLARIVQVEDLVKKDKSYPRGTVLHETTGHVIEPAQPWSPGAYRSKPVFRYRFGGSVKEGKRQYIELVVENLFLETIVTRQRDARHHSKSESPPRAAVLRSRAITVLLPIESRRAVFQFPAHVVTESRREAVAVAEAVLELDAGRLKVLEVAHKILPSSRLSWLPPGAWPAEAQRVYLDAPTDPATQGQ
jgi:hypothetical protein